MKRLLDEMEERPQVVSFMFLNVLTVVYIIVLFGARFLIEALI